METPAEQNHLKAIFKLSNASKRLVATSELSKYMKSKPSSVTDMLQRLAGKRLVNYIRYKGVSLTDKGLKKAIQVVRCHRLWEVFLVDQLSFKWDEVHEIAEYLEHINHPELVNRLDQFLGYPSRDPHGDIIPDANGDFRDHRALPLGEGKPDHTYVVAAVKDSTAGFLQFLDQQNIQIGSRLHILHSYAFDGSIEVKIDEGENKLLSAKVGMNIMVKSPQ
jgi:DtxR family Mn-dependent transcriptional regulator